MTYSLIRHAESEFNKMFAVVGYDGLFDRNFIDCSISDVGKQQVIAARQALQNTQINRVYVSPLRRTLQTALRIFEEHPSKPKMIVQPQLREFWFSSGDIPGDIHKTMKEFPMFDYTMITEMQNPEFWWAETMPDTEIITKLTNDLQNVKKEDRSLHLLETVEENGREYLENFGDFKLRTQNVKKFFREEAKENKIDDGQNIIVGHLAFFKMMTSTIYSPTGFCIDGIDMENCQIKEISF